MYSKGQHLGGFFTFLAGLIILVHVVVPHHHHFESTHSLEQESTCESSSQEENTETKDSHCRAFNVLVSERTTNFSVNQSLSEYLSFFLAGIVVNSEIPPAKNFTETIFCHQAIFLKQFFFTAPSLRGPPANA